MSYRAVDWAESLPLGVITDDERTVLTRLAWRANDETLAWKVSVAEIVQFRNVGLNKARKVLASLEQKGLIRREQTDGSVPMIFVLVDTPHGIVSPHGIDTPHETVSPHGIERGPLTELKGDPSRNREPYKEIQVRQVKKGCASGPSRPDDITTEAWDLLKRNRKAKHAVLTDRVINTLRKVCSAKGVALSDGIILMCEKGWQGLNHDGFARAIEAGEVPTSSEACCIADSEPPEGILTASKTIGGVVYVPAGWNPPAGRKYRMQNEDGSFGPVVDPRSALEAA